MPADISLFGPSVQDAQGLQTQQNQAAAMQSAAMGPQGNPFYVPGIAAQSHLGGQQLQQGLGGLFGVQPAVIKKAQDMQAIQQETEAAGVKFEDDPVGYMKIAASNMLKKGYRQEAMQALQQAQDYAANEATQKYKEASSNQLQASADVAQGTLEEKKSLMQAQAELAQAKGEAARIGGEIDRLKEARLRVKDENQKRLIDAQIQELGKRGDAALAKAASAGSRVKGPSANEYYTSLIAKEAGGTPLTATEQKAKQELAIILADPMRALMQNAIGGPAAPAIPRTPVAPSKASSPKKWNSSTQKWE
jgi:uncharacterized protein YdcH (DUF465 family)